MAVADVYAEALLASADANESADEVLEAYDDLVAYMDRDKDFDLFLTAESVDDDPRRESLEKLFRGKMNDLLLNLLQVLNDRFRMELVRPIHRCVVLRMEARRDQQEVVIESAKPLTDDQRSALKTQLSEQIGKEALLIEEVAPELLGGIVIRIDDLQIDGSVASRIGRLREQIFERSKHEIHAGRGFEETAARE
jgi:F-type H+-transporting ATPase subunit delta